ncbi:MAG: AmmeMemoRadiSam system radical SAM enzyme [Symbiobacteriaceae bacterium]|nr:AmmeMemoRadiSam system radical SAM enzyme [Symbiobacteriaceae bacterium]
MPRSKPPPPVARFWEPQGDYCRCLTCPQNCLVAPGSAGLCAGRINQGGELLAVNYGAISSLAMDPIEKKPLYRFQPGSYILSVGGYGCNLNCSFCQNFRISREIPPTRYISPPELVEIAGSYPQSVGVAFTYNEPLVAIEYLLDCAPQLQQAGEKVVLVTNGVISPEPLAQLLPYVDAMNIDIKGFNTTFYPKIGGSLEWVLPTVAAVWQRCHLEITTLVIPGENDDSKEIEALAAWLAALSPQIPLHLSRFFPRYRMLEVGATPVATLQRLAAVARKYLEYVYIGNV